MTLDGAPLDEEGFTLTDSWFCEETQTRYPIGTTVREIRRDMAGNDFEFRITSDDLRQHMDEETVLDEILGDDYETVRETIIRMAGHELPGVIFDAVQDYIDGKVDALKERRA